MTTTVDLDEVLDLVWKHQEDLAGRIDLQLRGTNTYNALWQEYKLISGLYDDIRRAAA